MRLKTSVRLYWSEKSIRGMSQRGGLVDNYTNVLAGRVRGEARRIIRSEGRIRTGALHDSIEITRAGDNDYQVGSRLDYAIYQHEGVKEVVPVRAKALRFKPKGSSVFVFAQRTKGFRGIKFLTRALRWVRP